MGAVFRTASGELFYVDYATKSDLERIVRESEVGGSNLISAGSLTEAQDTVKRSQTRSVDEPSQFRR